MAIQYIATFIIALFMIQLFIKFYKDKVIFGKILVWMTFWGIALFVVWFPEIIWQIGQVSGVGRGVDVLIYLSIIFLFFFLFNQNTKIDNLNKQITKIVREVAKENAKEK